MRPCLLGVIIIFRVRLRLLRVIIIYSKTVCWSYNKAAFVGPGYNKAAFVGSYNLE